MKVNKVLNRPFRQNNSGSIKRADNNQSYTEVSNKETSYVSNKSYEQKSNIVDMFPSNQDYNTASNNISFTGAADKAIDFVSKNAATIAGLAGASVVAQKIVMSGSEATIGPFMDIGVGKAITKATNEKDGRTNQSSKIQAVRTCAQSVGGTITGVLIRTGCIMASTFAASKAGGKIGEMVAEGVKDTSNKYLMSKQYEAWGKNIGGAVAIGVMMFTNFLIDAPFINWINKNLTNVVDKHSSKKQENNVKEAK